MPSHAVIDRFEGPLAILEVDGQERTVPRDRLGPDAAEGDVVDLDTLTVDREETLRRRDQVAALRRANRPSGGDFEL